MRGTLGEADAKVLIALMFDPELMAQAVGYIPDKYAKADPVNDPEFMAEATDHWWVELEDGTLLDPSFSDGAVRGIADSSYFEVPEAERHKVTLRLKAEFYNILSNFTYKTPLEHTFSTPEVYGKALSLAHFVSSYQPSALIGGFKTYTYSPFLIVDDNGATPDNNATLDSNSIIRGQDYQEFFSSLLPVLANSTLTRLTLDIDVQDPGMETETLSRDLLDRVGFAARHGLDSPQAVDSEMPAITEYDVATINILPGKTDTSAVVSITSQLADLYIESRKLSDETLPISQKDPSLWTVEEQSKLEHYKDLMVQLQIASTRYLGILFLKDSDYWTETTAKGHLVRAYFNSPRLILSSSFVHGDRATNDSSLHASLDLLKNRIQVIPYPRQNSIADVLFNASRGIRENILEKNAVEQMLEPDENAIVSLASAIEVFQNANEQKIEIINLFGEADIQKLMTLEISSEAKARITEALRLNKTVNVPVRAVSVDGNPAIAWYEINNTTGELIGVSEDGRHGIAEYVALLSVALQATGILWLINAFGWDRLMIFLANPPSSLPSGLQDGPLKNSWVDYAIWYQTEEGQMTLEQEAALENEKGIGFDFSEKDPDTGNPIIGHILLKVPFGKDVPVPIRFLEYIGAPVGVEGSVIRWAGLGLEVIGLMNPGPGSLSGSMISVPGLAMEILQEPAFTVAFGDASIGSAFQVNITNEGSEGSFQLSATDPVGGKVLLSVDTISIPAGKTGRASVYLQPSLNDSLPVSGTALPFSVTITREDNPAVNLTQNMAFAMPEVYTLRVEADPATLFSTPSGTVQTEINFSNTGNVVQTVGANLDVLPGFTVSDLGGPQVLNPGEVLSRTISFSAQGLDIDSDHYTQLIATYGDSGELETRVSLHLHVAAPGSLQALNAATDADALARPELADTLEILGQDLSSLYQDQTDETRKERVLAGLSGLLAQIDDPLLETFAADIAAAQQAIANSTPTTLASALDILAATLTPFGDQLAAMADHDFELALRPNSAEAQPQSPADFGLYLKNRGTESTVYSLSLAGVPAGITATLSQDSVTLPAGFAVEPGVTGTHHLPIAIDVTLTQPADELTAFEFELVVTADGAPQVQRSTYGSFTARDELVSVLSVTSTPAFTDPGGSVDVTTRLLNALNRERDLLVSYRVKNAGGGELFSSAPQAVQMSVLSSVATVSLGAFDTSGLPLGSYTLEVSVTESDGTPLAGGSGSGTLLVGSPLNATLSVDPDSLPAGDGQAAVTLQIGSLVDYDANGIALIGLTDTLGGGRSVAVRGDYAYLGGTEGVTVLNISTPQDPQIVHTFGSAGNNRTWIKGDYLLVAHEFDLSVYGLTDPAQPELLASAASGITGTHASGLYVQGDLAFVNTIIFIWGSSFVGIRGDTIIYDLTDPLNPQSLGLFYNTPQGSYPQWPGSNYFIGESAVGKDNVVYLMSSSAETDAVGGTGRLRMLDVSDPQNVTEAGVFDLPGSVLLGGMAIQGDRALVVGTDGPFVISDGSPVQSGQMTLHLLDVTDPLNPTILGSELLAGEGLYRLLLFTVRSVTDELFVIEDIALNGQAKLRLVDASDPANLRVIDIDTASVVGGALFSSGLLYTASNSGLGVYDLGGLIGIPVSAQVQVPNDGRAVILPGSFNRAPDSTTPGAGFDTLQWDLLLQTGQLSHVLNWQVQLDGLQPGEARDAALGGTVDFTAWGSAGSIQLPATSVAVEQVVALTPESRTMRPGEESLYTVTLMNPAATAMTYDLGLQGLPPEWVTLQATVEVPAAGSIDLPLTVRADALASLGEHGFAVTAATAGGARGLAYSRLVLEGTAVIQAEIHGVVITLTPLQDTAGQGTSATYRVRIINTGNVTETYELTGQLPVGIQGLFGETSVTVAPGLDNYREVLLTLTAPPGVAAGGQNFDVTATSTGTSGVTDQAAGTLNVSGFGVDVALTALAARPDDSTFLMRVTNTGQSQDTFDLSLGGVLAPAATLEITAVTLAAGASRDVTVTVIGIDFAYPGSLDLVVIATSRGDSNVQDRAAAAIDIPQSQGLTVSLEPVEVELPGVGDGAFLVLVQNSGNSEDAYSAAITGTGGVISAANLDGLDGQPTQSIPSFRLPGLATGAILLNVSLSSFGEGTVDVTIHSQSNAQISGTVTARLKTANQNPVADPGADRTIHLGDLVQLDGSNSTDPDQRPSSLTYAWSFIAVPPGSVLDDQAIAGANTVSASFTPDLTGQYRVQLIVSDGLLSDSREVAFQVENQVPVADAGPDLSVLIGEALILNGSGSHDPDRDLIRYWWTLAQTPAGSALTQDDIGNATTPEPSFTPDLAGLYELALVVTDGDLDSNPDPIRISAYDADLPPHADAGPDRNALVGDQAVLDGSGSYDPDTAPQPLTCRWTFANLPPGSALDDAAISNAASAVASFLPDVAGTYSLDLEVSDGLVQHSDQISVHCYLVETPPNADAGDDTLAGKGIPVSLDAGASSDPDTPSQGLSYTWSFVSIPQGSGLDNADLSNANTATPGFTPDVEGRYVLRLTLSDGTGEDSDNVMVSAKAGTGGDVVGAGGGGFGWLELWLLLTWLGIAGALRGRRRFGQLPVALMLAFLLAGGGLFPRPAEAADGPWYMGVSVGASKSAADAAELDASLAALGYSTISTLDNTDIGWKLFGGYQWNPNLAVEAALVDLGQVTSRISGNFGDDLDVFVADVARVHPYSARGISASIIGELPVAQRFRLFGKVGLFFWDADIDARFEVGGQPISFDSKQGVDPVFGAGMKFHINKKTAVRVEWERYEIDRDSVQLFSAGVEYRFP
ncbi:MAG: outer membrane beta-barrel protein [gamma proteobacterium endosymbiont of Lamellibrachia anaximandri]|nr:outer membrane beta-barrel protein [gamma proteobacterium endosymbiont of Lamellibrachia anaximandri]MBL3534660.1 outer membrane beta-barrel protein [gamma proteobacterium endosymbiont of Lamellibrachia anaximandri]